MTVARPQSHAPEYLFWTLRRIMQRSHDEGECRIWDGSLNKPGGYGRTTYRGRSFRVHRLFYEMMCGKIPDGMHILHSCDNPLCINPNHLRPGTHAENIREAYAKGRKIAPRRRAVLTVAQVREIRRSSEAGSALAKKFGVSKATVCRARRGETYHEEGL